MGVPVGRDDMRAKWPFHQLPPAGLGRCLSGEKKFGYKIILQNAQATKFKKRNKTNVPM